MVPRALPPEAPLNDRIAAALEGPPARAEEVAAFLREELPAVLAGLTELELMGVVRMVPGPRFALVEHVRPEERKKAPARRR